MPAALEASEIMDAWTPGPAADAPTPLAGPFHLTAESHVILRRGAAAAAAAAAAAGGRVWEGTGGKEGSVEGGRGPRRARGEEAALHAHHLGARKGTVCGLEEGVGGVAGHADGNEAGVAGDHQGLRQACADGLERRGKDRVYRRRRGGARAPGPGVGVGVEHALEQVDDGVKVGDRARGPVLLGRGAGGRGERVGVDADEAQELGEVGAGEVQAGQVGEGAVEP